MFGFINNIDTRIIFFLNSEIFTYPALGWLTYFLARFLIVVFIGIIVYLWFDKHYGGIVENRKIVILTIFTLILGFGIDLILGFLIARPRPYIAYPEYVKNLGLYVEFASFPSTHAISVFAISLTVLFSSHKDMGWILLVLSILIVISRVAAGVHYPSDVIGGAILGLLSALLIHKYKDRIFRIVYNK